MPSSGSKATKEVKRPTTRARVGSSDAQRPKKYSKKLANEILNAIEETRGSLRSVLDNNPQFPTRRTFYRWREKYEWLEKEYNFVCRVRDDDEFDEMTDIARNNDGSKEGTRKAKLLIDTSKWTLMKRQPVTYGTEKLEVENKHSGEISINITAYDEGEDGEHNDTV